MKRTILISCILITIISASFYTIWFTKQVKTELLELSKNAEIACDELDIEKYCDNINKLSANWESRQFILSLYIRHDDLENISNHIASLSAVAKREDISTAIVELYRLNFMLNHIYEHQLPSVNNLF